jgi:hypothetical protein
VAREFPSWGSEGMLVGHYAKLPLLLFSFVKIVDVLTDSAISDFIKIRPALSYLLHACRRADRAVYSVLYRDAKAPNEMVQRYVLNICRKGTKVQIRYRHRITAILIFQCVVFLLL